MLFRSNAWKRFGDVPETPFADYRALIQGDAVQLTRAASFVGVGPGNFAAVFPFYRTASWNEKRAVHPESDWLALAAEFGWLAVPLAWWVGRSIDPAIIIAVTTLGSTELLPGVKSVAEQGLPGFEFAGWVGFFAPKGTPAPVVSLINGEIAKLLSDPEIGRAHV